MAKKAVCMDIEYIYTHTHCTLEYDYITKRKTNKWYKLSVNMSWGGKDGKEGKKMERREKSGKEDSHSCF